MAQQSRYLRTTQSPGAPLRGSSFAELAARAAGTGRRVELYTRGQPITANNLIGAWIDVGGTLYPEGWIRFDRVTDTGEALATDATGPDSAVTVDTPGSFAQGDIVTVWRRSSNTQVAGARRVDDITGSVLTLSGTPFTTAIGDLVITANEFGPLLTQANGGLWVPARNNSVVRWSSGLEIAAQGDDDGAFLFMLGAAPYAYPLRFDLSAKLAVNEAAAGQNSTIGAGWKSKVANKVAGALLRHSDGLDTWNRGAYAGILGGLGIGLQGTNPDNAPGVGGMYLDWHVGAIGNGTACAYDTRAHSRDESNALIGNLAGGDSYSANNVVFSGLGAGTDGAPEGLHVLASLAGGGSLSVTYEQFRADWGLA